MKQLFTVDIGNTNTSFGIFRDGKISDFSVIPTSELSTEIIPHSIPVAVASVVPDKNNIFEEFCPLFISSELNLPVNFSNIDSKSMGADRIANSVALAKFARKLPAICIDCGTAITFEAVNAEKEFCGGVIAPGRKLWRRSLHSYTSLLPYIDHFEKDLSPGLSGKTTEISMLAGCDIGIIGMVKEILARFEELDGFSNCEVMVVGGDAEFFAENLLGVTYGGPEFTLTGIAEIFQYNH